MKRNLRLFMLVGLGLLLMVGSANADNIRQFGSVGSLSELQTLFTGIGSSIQAYGDQSTAAYFMPTGAGNSSAAYIATISWDEGSRLEFGIYALGDPSKKLKLWNSTTLPEPGNAVSFKFNQAENYVKSFDENGLIDQQTWFGSFGFYSYAAGYDATYFFSDDSLNPSGYARFLTYAAKGDNVTFPWGGPYNDAAHWYVASEVGRYSSTPYNWDTTTADFSDFIVQLESIEPVPEPVTLLLLGLGLVGIAGVRRKLK